MGDATRKDNGTGARKLSVLIELDLETELTTVETNIMDPAVMLRIVGQGVALWANDLMKKTAALASAIAQSKGRRPFVLPPKPKGD